MNPVNPSGHSASRRERFLAFVICACLVLALVGMGLLVPLLTGLLAFSLVHLISDRLTWRLAGRRRSRGFAVVLLALIVAALFVAAGAALHLAMRDGAAFHDLLERMAEIISSAATWLPPSISQMLPQSDAMFDSAGKWLNGHAAELGTISLDAFKLLGYALIGTLLGALVALSEMSPGPHLGPRSSALFTQVGALRSNFWSVASAQVRISALNTSLTALYLLVALPLFGVHLPLSKTLVTLTFVAGLLPVIGNLISNSAITIISLGFSGPVAVTSLAFLVGVHKLEYFLNARIVGGQINARAWEILIAMLVLERALGLSGVVIAPIFYAWLKSEWHRWDSPASAAR